MVKPESKKQPVVTNAPKKDTIIEPDKVYETTELTKQPEFPGGINNLHKKIFLLFRMPDIESMVDSNNEIRIVAKYRVSFVIEKNGTMTNIKVIKDPGFGLGNETVRTLESFPYKWKPGEINDTPVRATYILPMQMNIRA